MDNIGLYKQVTAFSNEHAGTAEWCMAERNGKQYFIKKFQSPVYPSKELGLSEKKYQTRAAKFHKTENAIKSMYQALTKANTSGALVVPIEVINFQYHICTVAEYVVGNVTPEQVCKLSEWQRIVLMRTLTLALMNVHHAGVVHSDMKPDNVLITQNAANGSCVLKLIDFDGSYMASNPPEDVTGDPAYYAPEAYAMVTTPSIRLDYRVDVFALGIIFHYFWTGRLPGTNSKSTIGQSVLNGERIILDSMLPSSLRMIIEQALVAEPEKRITTERIYAILEKMLSEYPVKLINLQKEWVVPKPFASSVSSSPTKKPVSSSSIKTEAKAASVEVVYRDKKGNILSKRIEKVPYGESRLIYPAIIHGYRLISGESAIKVVVDSKGVQSRRCEFTYAKKTIWKIGGGIAALLLLYWFTTILLANNAYNNGAWDKAIGYMNISPLYGQIYEEEYRDTRSAAASNSIVMNSVGTSCIRSLGNITASNYRYLKFVPATSGYYTFSSVGSFDTVGAICDANKSVLETNDDGGENNNFSIRYYFAAGRTYYLGTKLYRNNATGNITVRLTKD